MIISMVQGEAGTQIVLFLLCDRGSTRLLGDKNEKPRFFFSKKIQLRGPIAPNKIFYVWFSTQSQPST